MIVRCDKGHFYDDTKYFQCPHCKIEMGACIEGNDTKVNDITVMLNEQLYDDDATVSVYSGEKKDKKKVMGWLVCMEGIDIGKDYRIVNGFNRVGRSYLMDICIEGDPTITRDNHCSVVYDAASNRFVIVPAAGALTYLNQQLITSAMDLHENDELRVGNTTLLFVPFCKGERGWEEE